MFKSSASPVPCRTETLHELAIRCGEGVTQFKRAPVLHDSTLFLRTLTDKVHDHLSADENYRWRSALRWPGCENPVCHPALVSFAVAD